MNNYMNPPRTSAGDLSPFPESAWPGIAARLQMTAREASIVQGLFQRMNEEAIARKLGISRHTVHTHMNRLYRKLSVQSRGDLFLRVLQEYMGYEPVR